MGKFARKNQKELRQEAKKSLRKPRVKSSHVVDVDATNQVDTDAADFMYDEADQYHNRKQKILERGFDEADDDEESGSEEEVMPVGGDTTDEETDSDNEPRDEDADLPDRSAWGNKRSNFYHTDFVDKDHGRFQGSDAEEAEEEEREAKELQAKLAKELTNDDFGFVETLDTVPTTTQAETGTFDDVEKMQADIQKLSEFEKMERIKIESPELLDLISDGIRKMTELVNVIQPILAAISSSEKKLLTERAELFLRTKHQLILGYCQNVCFYMSLKAKRVSVENHPVTRRLVDFRRFLLKLDPLDKIYTRPMAAALALIKNNGDMTELLRKPENGRKKQRVTFGNSVTMSGSSELNGKDAPLSKRLKEKPAIKAKKSSSDTEDEEEEEEEEEQTGIPQAKRKLTYQIEKNKGTVPYRKKEYRNPRVKHRMKYRKAQISRKGQVQTHRPEMKKYSGEMTGIRAGVIRSIKFK